MREASAAEIETLRADAARLLPMGGENASDLGEWTYGLHVFFGFRNSIN